MASNIAELKAKIDTKTLNLVLLTFVTGGIYPLLWLYRNQDVIKDITKQELYNDTFIIWMAVCVGLSASIISGTNEFDETALAIGGILYIASWVLYIMWAFKAKKALQMYALEQHRFDFKMNGFYTFFLTLFYINYCINDLPNALAKHKIIHDLANTSQTEQHEAEETASQTTI